MIKRPSMKDMVKAEAVQPTAEAIQPKSETVQHTVQGKRRGLSITLSPGVHEQLEELSRTRRKTGKPYVWQLSTIVEEALEQYLKQHTA